MARRREQALAFPAEPGYPPIHAAVEHRVGFSEVDPMRIVWFGRYAVFFEQASAELRDQCGLSNEDFFRAVLPGAICSRQACRAAANDDNIIKLFTHYALPPLSLS